ncbi:hypothetical protein [Salinicoccus roseus]|uniref:hypothetical protein n=1 Tax=Salinicoccus roseus TaxID=45670 RepID=UPI002300F3D0|nr:hypothetical protein [Salinicoccus roseus]
MNQDNFNRMHKRISDRRRFAQDKYDTFQKEGYTNTSLAMQMLTEFIVLDAIWIEMNEMKSNERY